MCVEPDAEEAECHQTHIHTHISALRFHELGRLGHLLLSLNTQEVPEGQISLLNIREAKSGKVFRGKLEGVLMCVLFKRAAGEY